MASGRQSQNFRCNRQGYVDISVEQVRSHYYLPILFAFWLLFFAFEFFNWCDARCGLWAICIRDCVVHHAR